jgi:hypothetical protein
MWWERLRASTIVDAGGAAELGLQVARAVVS